MKRHDARSSGKPRAGRTRGRPHRRAPAAYPATAIEIQEIESLRDELKRLGATARLPAGTRSAKAGPPRWNANPDDARRSVVKLVLTLVEFIRQLLERQAIRRVDSATLTAEETEAIGLALMRLEDTIRELGAQFDIPTEELNLDLGPVGKLV
jgi:hypothetical protein